MSHYLPRVMPSRGPILTPRVRAIIIAALFGLLWLTWPRPPLPHLVVVAQEHIAVKYPDFGVHETVRQSGTFGTYRLAFTADRGRGDRISIVVTIRDHGDRLEVVGDSVSIGSGRSAAPWLLQAALAFVALYLVFFVGLPQRFGRKCPRDGKLLGSREVVVMPPRYGDDGVTLAAIIERWLECPACDFRHVEALADPRHRPNLLSESMIPHGHPLLSDRQVERTAEIIRQRRAEGMTEDEYRESMDRAKQDAQSKSSSDSPWLTGSAD